MKYDLIEKLRDDIRFHPDYDNFIFRLKGLHIHGVEVTQGIQYYRAAEHLTDPADQAADNSVTLVAGKPAWVRVYVRSGLGLANITGVTGAVEVHRRSHGFLYSPIGNVTPEPPGTVTARRNPAYLTERGALSYTLNFILPADYMCGTLMLKVSVEAPDGSNDDITVYLNVTLRQTLRLAGIMVGYNGPTSTAPGAPNLTLAAPTLANLQTTSAWALLTFPVESAATYRSAGTITWNLPLTDAPSCPGCCTPNWVALNAAVQAQKVADGNRTDVLYYGLMAVGIPMGTVIGCNSGGVSTGSNGDGVTLAHELGHACGLPHAPCGTPGDPNYPAYEPYDPVATPQASIGEYGLDISNGNIMSPATTKDMMAYCGPRWISLYNCGRLTDNANLDPVRTCVDYPWWRDIVAYDPLLILKKWLPDPPPEPDWRKPMLLPESLISIIGVVHSEDEIEIKSVMRLDAVREVANACTTELSAELVGEKGEVLARAPLYNLRSYGQGGCGCKHGEEAEQDRYPYLFQAFVSNVDVGAVLRIRHGEKEVWSRRAPATKPQVSDLKANYRKVRAGELEIKWKIKGKRERVREYWLQWSSDRGATWHALATGLQGSSGKIGTSGIPSGRINVRLLASDGFHTVTSMPITVDIPKRPPEISILSPRDGQTLIAGGTMRLLGAAKLGTQDSVPSKNVRWLVDGKKAGMGLDVFVTAPAAGEHRLTLVVAAQKEKSEQSIKFVTVEVPRDDDAD